jgi:hypothetical protein
MTQITVLIGVNPCQLDPSTEFILSAVERAQGTLFEKKRDLKKQTCPEHRRMEPISQALPGNPKF